MSCTCRTRGIFHGPRCPREGQPPPFAPYPRSKFLPGTMVKRPPAEFDWAAFLVLRRYGEY